MSPWLMRVCYSLDSCMHTDCVEMPLFPHLISCLDWDGTDLIMVVYVRSDYDASDLLYDNDCIVPYARVRVRNVSSVWWGSVENTCGTLGIRARKLRVIRSTTKLN